MTREEYQALDDDGKMLARLKALDDIARASDIDLTIRPKDTAEQEVEVLSVDPKRVIGIAEGAVFIGTVKSTNPDGTVVMTMEERAAKGVRDRIMSNSKRMAAKRNMKFLRGWPSVGDQLLIEEVDSATDGIQRKETD
ncbi:MAG: hypothetical protein AAGI92_07970 [Pseudomonadota bacterium]